MLALDGGYSDSGNGSYARGLINAVQLSTTLASGLPEGHGGPGLVDRHVVGAERSAVHALERLEAALRVGDGDRHVDAQVGAGSPCGVQELGCCRPRDRRGGEADA